MPPPTAANNKMTQTVINIQLFERPGGFDCSELSSLSSRAPKASAEAAWLTPKLAPPLKVPNTARELSAGFSSTAGNCPRIVGSREAAETPEPVGSSPRSSLSVSGATGTAGGAAGKAGTLLSSGAEICSSESAILGMSTFGTSRGRNCVTGVCTTGTAGRGEWLGVPGLIVAVADAAG